MEPLFEMLIVLLFRFSFLFPNNYVYKEIHSFTSYLSWWIFLIISNIVLLIAEDNSGKPAYARIPADF